MNRTDQHAEAASGPDLEPVPEDTIAPPENGPEGSGVGAVLRRLGPAAILGALWTAMPALAGIALLTWMGTVAGWLVEHRALGLFLYVSIFILSAGFGVLPTYAQALLAGYAFGVWVGFPAALTGFAGASMIGYMVARRVGRERVEREIGRYPRARAVRDALIGRGFWPTLGIVTLVRVPPNSPFALTNLALSTTGVRKRIYLLGTVVGMAPRTLAAVIIGSRITDFTDSPKPVWWVAAGIALTLVALLIIGHIANKALDRMTTARGEAEPDAGG